MPDPKMLSQNVWKTMSAKFKVKEPDLQKALAEYDSLGDDEHDELLACATEIKKLALEFKKSKEVAANSALVKYLAEMVSAAEAEQRDVTKDKAQAEKENATRKKAEEQEGDEDEEQEEEADYKGMLTAALRKLKGAKDVSYQFIVCDAKPHCAVMVAKRISTKHREELTKITGSKRFLHLGECRFDDGHFVFSTEKPVPGLARKLQDSLKHHTGKKHPIMVGTETADSDEEGEAEGADAAPEPQAANVPADRQEESAAQRQPRPELAKAPEAWHQTRSEIEGTIKQLKDAVRKAFAEQGPEMIAEIDQNMTKLDAILDKLDRRLADSLAKAHAAQDPAARRNELAQSKTILADYIKYVKSEPMIGHIDSNPFGVKTNLKQKLSSKLTEMAQAMS
jgi:hypothetical protein